ncbi:MAG: hypothetical protein ACW98Y_13710 [Candidatus Thorarchaeota archaeon]|jgi:hypothetical protein
MNKPELFGLAGLFIFLGLWVTMASLPNPYVYPPAVGIGVFLGAVGFFLIGIALDGDGTRGNVSKSSSDTNEIQ